MLYTQGWGKPWKFDVKSDVGIFLGYSTMSRTYRAYNQNSQVIQEYSNVVINDIGYDQDILKSQILTYESIGDNPKDWEITKENPNDIPEEDINLNIDEFLPLNNILEEIRDKHRSRIPGNYLISNVIGNVNKRVVTMRQLRLNEMGLVCYTSQLEPKNVDEAFGDES